MNSGLKYNLNALTIIIIVFLICFSLSGCVSETPVSPSPSPEVATDSSDRSEQDDIETNKRVMIAGIGYPSDSEKLSIYKPGTSLEDLYAVLDYFTELSQVDIRHTFITPEEALELSDSYPFIHFVWTNTVFDNPVDSDVEELDVSGLELCSVEEIETYLPYFTNLQKVIMCDCGIPDNEMDELNHRYPDIQFVWTVHFGIYSLRTDATYFCASDLPNRGYIAPRLNEKQLDPIKYCTDLEALDLGHMNYKNVDFLSDMTKMKYLILVQSPFSDLSPLANMTDLEYLELFANNKIVDLSPLKACTKLKHLNIGYCYYAEWQTLMDMPCLERLWMPHVKITRDEQITLAEALPNTQIYCPASDRMGSTGGGWREDQSYYDMRDIMHMFYLPGGTGM